jgi:hypothetical protein
MIQIPLYLAVVQWVVLLSLGLLVLLMYRQLARQMGIGARPQEPGLPTGTRATAFDYVSVPANGARRQARFEPASGRPALVLFADPSCTACDEALIALEDAVRSTAGEDLVVLVVTTEPDTYLAASKAFQTTMLPLARVANDVARSYRVDVTPFAYGIDRRGVIRASLVPRSARDFEAMARAAAETASHSPLEV